MTSNSDAQGVAGTPYDSFTLFLILILLVLSETGHQVPDSRRKPANRP